MDKKVITTEDGSKTIFVPSLNEHYHSSHGAIQESMHIFIKYGFKEINRSEINIFEVGFGTGLNAFLTALEAENMGVKVNYITIEKYPLDQNLVASLNYSDFFGEPSRVLFDDLHGCEWNKTHQISEHFSIKKVQEDMRKYVPQDMFDLIYFDAFGPDKQPDMWSDMIISNISNACNTGAFFLTYSAKGELKRQLIASGFNVLHLPGPPGKREITWAVKL